MLFSLRISPLTPNLRACAFVLSDRIAGTDDDPHSLVYGSDRLSYVQTGHSGHHEIGHDDIEVVASAPEVPHCLGRIGESLDPIVQPAEDPLDNERHDLIVIEIHHTLAGSVLHGGRLSIGLQVRTV